ncbi:MAG: inorganic phosphate transporter [Candidatus Heimdallarchaeaceae archaeon]
MEILIISLLVLMVLLAFGIGANDETMATLVGSRAVKFKYAIILGSVLVFVGVLFLSAGVGKTIGANLLGSEVEYNFFMMFDCGFTNWGSNFNNTFCCRFGFWNFDYLEYK